MKFISSVIEKFKKLSFVQKSGIILWFILFIFFLTFVIKQYTSFNSYHPRDFAAEANPIARTIFAGKFFDSMALCGYPFFLQTHLSIVPFLMIPFLFIFPSGITLLFISTLLIFTGLIFLFLTARKILKSDLLAILITLSFLLYLPVQHNILNDWRYNFFYIPVVILTFYFYINRRFGLFLIFFIVTLFTRDEGLFVVLFFPLLEILNTLFYKYLPGTELFEEKKPDIRYIIFPVISSILFFIIFSYGFKHIIVKYTEYKSPIFLFERYGSNTLEAAKNIVLNFFNVLFKDLLQPQKIKFFIKDIFLPLLFLPVIGFQSFILSLPTIFLYLMFDYPKDVSISSPFFITTAGVRYITFFLSYMGIGLIFGLKNISLIIKNEKYFKFIATVLLLITIWIGLSNSPLPLPFSTKYDPSRFTIKERDIKIKEMLKRIKRKERVMTQFDYLAYFLHSPYLGDINFAFGFNYKLNPLGEKLFLDLKKRWFFNLDHFFFNMWRYRNSNPSYIIEDTYDGAFIFRILKTNERPDSKTEQFWNILFSPRFAVKFNERYAYISKEESSYPLLYSYPKGLNIFKPFIEKREDGILINIPLNISKDTKFRKKDFEKLESDELSDNIIFNLIINSRTESIQRNIKPVVPVRFFEKEKIFKSQIFIERERLPSTIQIQIFEDRDGEFVSILPQPIIIRAGY